MSTHHVAARLVALHRRLNDLDPEDPRYVRAAETLAIETASALNSWLYTRSETSERIATLHAASFAPDERPRAGLWLDDLTPEAANERLRGGDRGLFAAPPRLYAIARRIDATLADALGKKGIPYEAITTKTAGGVREAGWSGDVEIIRYVHDGETRWAAEQILVAPPDSFLAVAVTLRGGSPPSDEEWLEAAKFARAVRGEVPPTIWRDLRSLILSATAARWHEGTSPATAAAQLAIQALAYEPYRRAVDPPRRHPMLAVGSATQTDRLRASLVRESVAGEYAVSNRGPTPVWSEDELERVLALADATPEPEGE